MPRAPAVRNHITAGAAGATRPRIVVLTGAGERRAVPLDASLTIGADAEACDLVVATAGVARRHARLIPVDGGVVVRDLRSRTGTFRNGRRISGPERLDDGDVITVGDADLRYDASSRPRRRPRPGGPAAPPAPAEAAAAAGGDRPVDARAALAEALRTALAADAEVRPVAPSRTVLLCHDPADRDVADLLVAYLQRRGHAVWVDRSAPGQVDGWRGRLLDVVWSSDAALFLVSPASAASERAQREVHLAGAERLPVLPVLAADADLEPALAWYLGQHEPIDLRTGPMAGLADLAVAVEALPARRLARPRRVAIGALLAAALVTAIVLGARALLG